VKGDKGWADKEGEQLLHVVTQIAAVLDREQVLLPRTFLPCIFLLLAALGIIHFQGISDFLRELILRDVFRSSKETIPRRDEMK
jgi:hypothetical protein